MDLMGNVKNRVMLQARSRSIGRLQGGDPEAQAANHDTNGAEGDIAKRSVPARGLELSDFDDRRVADQEDAVCGKMWMDRVCHSHHDRRAKMGDEVLDLPTRRRSRDHAARRQRKSCQHRDAAGRGDAPQNEQPPVDQSPMHLFSDWRAQQMPVPMKVQRSSCACSASQRPIRAKPLHIVIRCAHAALPFDLHAPQLGHRARPRRRAKVSPGVWSRTMSRWYQAAALCCAASLAFPGGRDVSAQVGGVAGTVGAAVGGVAGAVGGVGAAAGAAVGGAAGTAGAAVGAAVGAVGGVSGSGGGGAGVSGSGGGGASSSSAGASAGTAGSGSAPGAAAGGATSSGASDSGGSAGGTGGASTGGGATGVGNGASSAAGNDVAHNAGAISTGLSGSTAAPAAGSTGNENATGGDWPVFSASTASPAGPSKHYFAMQAVYFRPEKFKSKADCLTAAHRQLLPLEVCR